MTQNITGGIEAALAVARDAEVVVLMLGIDGSLEGESNDRTSIDLPAIQHELAAAVLALGKPTVIVLINGGVVGIAQEKESAPAILEAWYPGFWGARAIADTLFGDNHNLGGKLPVTWYDKNYVNEVKMSNMDFRPQAGVSPGRTYRYFTGQPTYPAFTGISLTTFEVSAAVEQQQAMDRSLFIQTGDLQAHASRTLKVTNNGSRTGDEVIFMFVSEHNSTSGLIRRLADFQRVHLAPGQSANVTFDITAELLKITELSTGNIVSRPGEFTVSFSTGGEQALFSQHVEVKAKGPNQIPVVLEKFPLY